ncbi:MAG: hypothetical protein AB7G93_04255 [Bdellovibrionales bacterium]
MRIVPLLSPLILFTSQWAWSDAPQIPGIETIPVARCQSSPRLVGDVGRPGNLEAVVTENIREFTSYYQVQITDLTTDRPVATLVGQPLEDGRIIMERPAGAAGSEDARVFEINSNRTLATLKGEDESSSIDFLCTPAG